MTTPRNLRRALRALLRTSLRALRCATRQPEHLPQPARYHLVRALSALELALEECSEKAWATRPTNTGDPS